MNNFNLEKMLAAVAYVCNQNAGKYDKLELIKVLYIAERNSICETFNTITGDTLQRYKFGPALKRLYNVIYDTTATSLKEQWNIYFKNSKKEEQIVLIKEPNMNKLSYADRLFLDNGIRFMGTCKEGELVSKVHSFPELHSENNECNISIDCILKMYRPDLTKYEREKLIDELSI